MSLTGIPPAQKPPKPIRDKAHLLFVGQHPCVSCGRVAIEGFPNDAAHIGLGRNCMGRKSGDDTTVPLCRPCHAVQTWQESEGTFWGKLGKNPFRIAAQLWHERTGQWPEWYQEENDGT